MNRQEITALNARLKPLNRKYCPCCEDVFDRTEEYWYVHRCKNGKSWFSANCRACTSAINSERDRQRYKHNSDARERKNAASLAYQQRPENRERYREKDRRYRANKRRHQFRRLLGNAA